MRARWESLYWRQLERYAKLHTRTDEAERQVRGLRADLWQRDGQVENQASQIVALETERDELKQSLDGTREQLRQAQAERKRDAELVTPEVLSAAMRRLEIPGQREEKHR